MCQFPGGYDFFVDSTQLSSCDFAAIPYASPIKGWSHYQLHMGSNTSDFAIMLFNKNDSKQIPCNIKVEEKIFNLYMPPPFLMVKVNSITVTVQSPQSIRSKLHPSISTGTEVASGLAGWLGGSRSAQAIFLLGLFGRSFWSCVTWARITLGVTEFVFFLSGGGIVETLSAMVCFLFLARVPCNLLQIRGLHTTFFYIISIM